MLEAIPVMATAVYAVMMLYAVIAAVELAGYFPNAARPRALRSGSGAALVTVLLVTAIVLLGTALWLAVTRIPWAVAVITAGLAILLGPLVFQAIPRAVWDSRPAVAVMAVVGLGLVLFPGVANL